METRFTAIVLAGLMVLVGVSCQQQAGISENDRAAIMKVCDEGIEMVIGPNVDWDAYVNFVYTEDAEILFPGTPAIKGREAIKAAVSTMGTIQDWKLDNRIIEGRGDLAYEQGTYTQTFTPSGALAPISDRGKYITVWKKQSDGTWKAARDIGNSDLPPEGMVLPTGAMRADAGPELARFGWMVGTWRLDGESKGSPAMPAGKMTATLNCQWFSGGSQLLCLYNIANPNGPVQEFSVYGYDPDAKAYWNYTMDSTGLSTLGKVVIEETGWTHLWNLSMRGKPVKWRLVLSDVTPNGCAWKNEYSVAGGAWIPIAEGRAVKIK